MCNLLAISEPRTFASASERIAPMAGNREKCQKDTGLKTPEIGPGKCWRDSGEVASGTHECRYNSTFSPKVCFIITEELFFTVIFILRLLSSLGVF